MVFSSSEFLLFFLPAVLLLYHVSRNRTYRNGVLLVASLVFYAWGEPLFVFVMIFSVMLNWLFGLGINRGKGKKIILLSGVCWNVLLLLLFKYIGFLAENIGRLFGQQWDWSLPLPIGISFFTFQILSYLLDVYYGKADLQKNPLNLLLYISMFPQLIAGPIVRYQTIAEEINSRQENAADFTRGILRFVVGLAKKVLIANYAAVLADAVFGLDAGSLSVCNAWLGAFAYTIQIYFDFSGYSDMAIGLGLVFGFHFEENFRYPYAASSVTDFWRRWHISLSSWFRDYVYIPMGGNRHGRKRQMLNLFVVWLLSGIWHGANWTFVLWGFCYFLLLSFEKLTGMDKKKNVFSHLYTLFFVVLLWVLFRSETLPSAVAYIGAMFGGGNGLMDDLFRFYLKNCWPVLLIGVIFSFPGAKNIWSFLERKCLAKAAEAGGRKKKVIPFVLSVVKGGAFLVLFLLCLCVCEKSTYNPFIYFNF